MHKLRNPKVQGALRHLLTAVGPVLASQGIASEQAWAVVVGVIMAGLGFWASWTAKEKNDGA